MLDMLEANALDYFLERVRDSIAVEGPAKGYSGATYDLFGPGHSMGEIYCKLRRWETQRNDNDLIKVAGHAFVLYWNSIKGDSNDKEIRTADSNRKSTDVHADGLSENSPYGEMGVAVSPV